MGIKEIAHSRATRNAELAPNYQYKTMRNGKTFVYYKSCMTPCAMIEDTKLFVNGERVFTGPIKSCLVYLDKHSIGK